MTGRRAVRRRIEDLRERAEDDGDDWHREAGRERREAKALVGVDLSAFPGTERANDHAHGPVVVSEDVAGAADECRGATVRACPPLAEAVAERAAEDDARDSAEDGSAHGGAGDP